MDNAPLLAIAEPLIKREESCRLVAYQDTRGIWTIGWGRADPGVREGMTCTQEMADYWFEVKVVGLCAQLDHAMGWWRTLDLPREAVLLSMAYQLGVEGLEEFHRALGAMQDGAWPVASAMMLLSDWAKQTPARAEREAAIMKSGIIPA